MRKYLLSFCLLMLLSCSPAFIQTGPKYEPLADSIPVQVFLGEERPTKYVELGTVEIKTSGLFKHPLPDAVDQAKKLARKHGGNCVLSSEPLKDRTVAELAKKKNYSFIIAYIQK